MAVLEDVFETSLADLWYDTQEEFDLEMGRARTNKKRFEAMREMAQRDWLVHDMEVAQRIHDDIAGVVQLVERGSRYDSKRFDDMLFVHSIANHVLSCDNDVLDGAFGAGLASALVLLPWAVLKRRAQLLQEKLAALEKLLKQAKRETTEAGAQLVINAAISGILLCTGPVGLLAGGGIVVAQIVLDDVLGPSTSDAATLGSRVNSSTGPLLEAVETMDKFGSKTKSVAGKAGKAVPVVGFLFDVNEIHTAVGNVSRIEAAMTSAAAALKSLQREITLNKAKLDKFFIAMRAYQKELNGISEAAGDARVDLLRAMDKVGYHP